MCSYHRFVPLDKISSRIFSTARSSLSAPTAVRTIRTVRLNSLADIVSLFPCLRVLEREVHTHTFSVRAVDRMHERHLRLERPSRSPAPAKSPFKHKTSGRAQKYIPIVKNCDSGLVISSSEEDDAGGCYHNLRKSLIAKPRARLFGFSRETEQLVARHSRAVNTAN